MAEEQKDLVAIKVAFAGGTDNVALSGEAAFPAGSHYRTFAAAGYSDGATVNVLMVEAGDASKFELHALAPYATAAGGSITRSTGTLVLGSNGASLVSFAAADLVVSDVGTAARRMADVARIAALESMPVSLTIACSNETSPLTTGTAKVTFRMPHAMTLTAVRASVTTAPTGSVLTVDINEAGSAILGTKLTIAAGSKTSVGGTAPTITDSAIADDAEMTIDIDTVGSSVAGAGLKVTLIGTRP